MLTLSNLLEKTWVADVDNKIKLISPLTVNVPRQEDAASLDAILKHSLFNTEKELFTELRAVSTAGPTGTRIIIWNLRMWASGLSYMCIPVVSKSMFPTKLK